MLSKKTLCELEEMNIIETEAAFGDADETLIYVNDDGEKRKFLVDGMSAEELLLKIELLQLKKLRSIETYIAIAFWGSLILGALAFIVGALG